jgi:hypothetical protein
MILKLQSSLLKTEGGDESIEFKSSSNDPEESNLIVDNDEESDWHEVFAFELESEENDIELDEIVVTVSTDTENYEDVVNDAMLTIDGEEFTDFDVTAGASTTATLTFNIDGDFTVDADESVEAVLSLEFKDTDNQARYANGETITAATDSVEGEGVDDVIDGTNCYRRNSYSYC